MDEIEVSDSAAEGYMKLTGCVSKKRSKNKIRKLLDTAQKLDVKCYLSDTNLIIIERNQKIISVHKIKRKIFDRTI